MMGVLSKAVAILILFAGCNFVYGLEPTGAAPDGDGDGVSDVEDNCTGVTNSDQADADDDGLGDLCDLCPLVFDDRNHDEDLDGVGDRCDACPGFAEFQRDGDGDGIGDLCDDVPSADTQRSVFDPFLELDPGRWQTGPTGWRVDNEAVVPVAELGPGEGLRPIVALSNRPWAIHVGVRSRRVWTGTDTFGIRIVDADGTKASCVMTCEPSGCAVNLLGRSMGSTVSTPVFFDVLPQTILSFTAVPMGGNTVFGCTSLARSGASVTAYLSDNQGTIELIAHPNHELTFFELLN